MVAPKSRGPIYKAQLQFFENFSNSILSVPYGLKVMVNAGHRKFFFKSAVRKSATEFQFS